MLRAGVTDYDNATDIQSMHIAFLVDEDAFDAAHGRLNDVGAAT